MFDPENPSSPPGRLMFTTADSALDKIDLRRSHRFSTISGLSKGEVVIGHPTAKIPRVKNARLSTVLPPGQINISTHRRSASLPAIAKPAPLPELSASQTSTHSNEQKRNRLSKARFSTSHARSSSSFNNAIVEPASPNSPGLMMRDAGADPFKAASPKERIAAALRRTSESLIGIPPLSPSPSLVSTRVNTTMISSPRPLALPTLVSERDWKHKEHTPRMEKGSQQQWLSSRAKEDSGKPPLTVASPRDDVEEGEMLFSTPKILAFSRPGAPSFPSGLNISSPAKLGSRPKVNNQSSRVSDLYRSRESPRYPENITRFSTQTAKTTFTQVVRRQDADLGYSFAAQYAPPSPVTALHSPNTPYTPYAPAHAYPNTPTSATPMMSKQPPAQRSMSSRMPYPQLSSNALATKSHPNPKRISPPRPPGLFDFSTTAPSLFHTPSPQPPVPAHLHTRGASDPLPSTPNRLNADNRMSAVRMGRALEEQTRIRVTSAPIMEFEFDPRRRSSNVLPRPELVIHDIPALPRGPLRVVNVSDSSPTTGGSSPSSTDHEPFAPVTKPSQYPLQKNQS